MVQKLFAFFLICMMGGTPLYSSPAEKAWIDFPGEPLPVLLKSSDRFSELLLQISNYHKLDKQSVVLLKKRITALNQISRGLKDFSNQAQTKKEIKELKALSLIASKKAWYLKRLGEIYSKNLDHYQAMKSTYGMDPNPSNSLLALPLINKIIYDIRLPGYWGMYWLEALDPCHRLVLTPHYIRWKKEKSSVPFFMWLETQDIQFRAIQIDIYDQKQIQEHTCYISKNDHLIYDSSHKVVNYTNQNIEYLYIITLDKEVIIAPGSEKVRHLSLSLGRPVLAAGALKVSRGKITYIDVESGHYQPTSLHMQQAVDLFKSLGAFIASSVEVKFYEEGKTIRSTVKALQNEKHVMNKGTDPSEAFLPFFSLRKS